MVLVEDGLLSFRSFLNLDLVHERLQVRLATCQYGERLLRIVLNYFRAECDPFFVDIRRCLARHCLPSFRLHCVAVKRVDELVSGISGKHAIYFNNGVCRLCEDCLCTAAAVVRRRCAALVPAFSWFFVMAVCDSRLATLQDK